MEFNEFKEYPKLDENNYDVKSALGADPNIVSSNSNNEPSTSDSLDELVKSILDPEVPEEDFSSIPDSEVQAILDSSNEDELPGVPDVSDEEVQAILDHEPVEEDTHYLSGDLDIFSDDNLEETLRQYNYDYKSLLRELTSFIDYSVLIEMLGELGIKKEEYLNPTYVTFEKIRNRIIKNRTK